MTHTCFEKRRARKPKSRRLEGAPYFFSLSGSLPAALLRRRRIREAESTHKADRQGEEGGWTHRQRVCVLR